MRRGARLCSVRPPDRRPPTGAGPAARGWILRCAAVLLVGACGAVLLVGACGARPAAPPTSHEIPPEREFLQQVDRTRGVKDMFTPLRDPPFVAAADATRMTDDELVVGLDLGTEHVAYPVLYLNHHEIVEHRLAGLELLACW